MREAVRIDSLEDATEHAGALPAAVNSEMPANE
jgi:hypothetical protein